MSKRKSLSDYSEAPKALTLDEEQLAALQSLSETLHPGLKCLLPVFETICQAHDDVVPPHRRALPVKITYMTLIDVYTKIKQSRQATDFKRTTAAAIALGVDFKDEDLSYLMSLKTEQLQDSGQLSEHHAAVIKDLKTSNYVSTRQDESFARTILDLLMVDRLRYLEDRDAFNHLQVSAEVPVSIRVKDVYGNEEVVKGRADWALGYGVEKSDTGTILLVVEAKPYEAAPIGMPQLLVYMAAVYEARKNRVNRSVFGMLSDSKEFRFSLLDENKKLFTSRTYNWLTDQPTIIAYIDMMLISAIESSPHTTPTKHKNQTILRHRDFLRQRWDFGDASDDEGAEEGETEYEMVDVVNIGGRVILKGFKR